MAVSTSPGRANLRARHFARTLFGKPFAEVEIGASGCKIRQCNLAAVLHLQLDFTGASTDIADGSMVVESRTPGVVPELRDPLELFAPG